MGNQSTFHSYHEEGNLYFVTATICGWKNILNIDKYARIVLHSLAWMRSKKRLKLFSFCSYAFTSSCNNTSLKRYHRHNTSTIWSSSPWSMKYYKQSRIDNNSELVDFFHSQNVRRKHNHRIWQDIQAKNIYSDEFLEQKMEYIHNNPLVSGCLEKKTVQCIYTQVLVIIMRERIL